MSAEYNSRAAESKPLLSVQNLSLAYARRSLFASGPPETIALRDVSFDLFEGRTLALIGPSGSGKSSLARCLVLLETPSAGRILYKGTDVLQLPSEARKSFRREIHLVFQEAASALNPRLTVKEIVAEPLMIHREFRAGAKVKERVAELLDQVELGPTWHDRKPLQLSGGQRQRVAIARGLALRPRILILDEALSSLDLSAQAQIANLLLDLQERQGLAYLYVTHDTRMARTLSDKVAVMDDGRISQTGLPGDVLTPSLQTLS